MARENYDLFDVVNNLFGNFDKVMREVEEEFNTPNLFPSITIPSIKTYFTENRAVSDDEKTTYYHNGKVSRLDGPAVVWHDTEREDEWWVEGKLMTEKEVAKLKQKMEDEKEHEVFVDGKKVKIKGSKLKQLKELLDGNE